MDGLVWLERLAQNRPITATPSSGELMSNQQVHTPWLKHYDQHVPARLNYEDKIFSQKFAQMVEKFPDKAALIYMGKSISYRELDVLANKVANHLIQSGLLPGDVVGLHMPNLPANYISVVAIQKAGCISTGLSPLLTRQEMEHQVNDSGAKAIISTDILFEKVSEVANTTRFTTAIVTEIADFLPAPKRILGRLLKKIPTAPVHPLAGKTVTRFMDVIQSASSAAVNVKRSMEDPLFMMYTGGTTGPSKGALITQRGFMCNQTQVITWLNLVSDDMALSAFPLFHIAGLALGGFSLLNGATQVCVPNPRDTGFLIKAIKTYRPSMIVNVPTIYFELMKRPEFRALDMGRLKWCLSASAPFPAPYFSEIESIVGKGRFIELYGMTETSPVTCCNPRHGAKKPSSIGMPLSDTEFKLVDPTTGELVKQGEPGEIAIRGPQLMKGYHNKPEETAHAMRDGWMFTGDVATMDEDGYFYLVDRVKDMVIVSGYKVFTRELDEVIMKHPDVELAASVGIPDPERPGSERVAAAVVLKPGVARTDAQKAHLTAYLHDTVAPYKVPKRIEFLDQLPTSGVGKVLKRELKRMLSGDSTGGP